MKIITGCLSLCVLLMAGCGTDKKSLEFISDEDFATGDTLAHTIIESINIDTVVDPRFIDVEDTLLVLTQNTRENIFSFFSLNDFSKVSEFGNQGDGPGEVSFPAFMNTGAMNAKAGTFEFLDWGRRSVSSYNLNAILEGETVQPEFEYYLPAEFLQTQRAEFIQDNRFVIGSGALRQGKIAKISTQTDTAVAIQDFYPPQEDALENRSVGRIYAGEFLVNEEKERIIVTTRRFKILELFDLDLNLIKRAEWEEGMTTILGSNGRSHTVETMYHFVHACASEKHIYALYEGNSDGTYTEGEDEDVANSVVYVFDWDLNPVKKIYMDAALSKIDVDDTGNRMYAIISPYLIDSSNPDPVVYYDLN